MQVEPAAGAGCLNVGDQPVRWRGQGRQRLIEERRLRQPGHDVRAVQAARHPRGPATGQEHVAPGEVQLLGQLASGLAAADDEDAAGRYLVRVAVVGARQREHARRQGGRGRWQVGPLIGAGAHDHRRGLEPALGGDELEVSIGVAQLLHVHALAHRHRATVGVLLEVGDDLVAPHVAVRIIAGIGAAGQVEGPVRSHQREAVPALTPGLGDPRAFQHDMLDAERGELPADGQPRLTRPDHHDRHDAHPRAAAAADASTTRR